MMLQKIWRHILEDYLMKTALYDLYGVVHFRDMSLRNDFEIQSEL